VDLAKIGNPYETILARKRESLLTTLSLGHPEDPMIPGIVDRDGAMVVEYQTPSLGKDSVAKVVLRTYRARPSQSGRPPVPQCRHGTIADLIDRGVHTTVFLR
jgi:hypothetical protein